MQWPICLAEQKLDSSSDLRGLALHSTGLEKEAKASNSRAIRFQGGLNGKQPGAFKLATCMHELFLAIASASV